MPLMASWYTAVGDVAKNVATLRESFRSGKTKPLAWRRQQLMGLYNLCEQNKDALAKACFQDLHKPKEEAILTEIAMVGSDVCMTLEHLEDWVGPRKVQGVEFLHSLDKPTVRHDPLGVVLIIGAWNYPVQLTLVPLIGAIAGGNCAVIKPSEVSPHTAQLLADLIPKYLDPQCFKVINGAVPETTALLEQRFDHILYTGGSMVGKIIMAAAAKHLTPVTLELGGKSPCIVDSAAKIDIDTVARRIVWGRFLNCGQTCIAPDYILCEPATQDVLASALAKAVKEFYTENPQTCSDYARVVNERHFLRVKSLLESKGSGEVVVGGTCDQKDLYIAPTVLKNTNPTSDIMQQEIFGPLLPMVTVPSMDAAIDFVNKREKPLALYVFSKDNAYIEKVLAETSSGNAVINDTLMHAGVPQLPFGGVGCSGMGAYHGKHTFDMFTHKKGYLVKTQSGEFANAIRYPPYSAKKLSWISWLMFKKPGGGKKWLKPALYAVLVAFLAYFVRRSGLYVGFR